jgi:DivIVA domain-containing protein
VTKNDDHDFPYYRSPAAIRDETFSRRMRGLDDDEVDEYLNLLADQVQAMELERQELREQNERLEAENHRLRTDDARLRSEVQRMRDSLAEHEQAGGRVNEQVVELFSQAQLVAEEMVEDARQDTRQRLGQARIQERQILEEAMQSAERTLRDAEAMVARMAPGPAAGARAAHRGVPRDGEPAQPGAEPAADLEHVRSVARAAQEQMQAIMDEFSSQMTRIGGSPSGDPAGGPSEGWRVESPRRPGVDPWGAA